MLHRRGRVRLLVLDSSSTENGLRRHLKEVHALALGLLLIHIAKVLLYQLLQHVAICLCLQFVEDLLNDEEALLVLDHALHDVVSLQYLKESLNGCL